MSTFKDSKLFPTMVVGSLPRPQWVLDLIEDRTQGRINEKEADKLLDPAVLSAIRMQERAGLDYISDGEWRRENYVRIFADRVGGFRRKVTGTDPPRGQKYSAAVVSRLEPHHPIACEEADFLRRNTDHKIIVALPAPYTIGRRMWDQEVSIGAYPAREAFMKDCVPIIRQEVIELSKLGVDAIQLDDPWLSRLVDPRYLQQEGIEDIQKELEISVETINQVTEGLEDVFISVHLCHAHGYRRHSTEGAYDPIMCALQRMNVNRFAMEFATPVAGGVRALKDFPSDKILGLGVIDHTNQKVETPQQVVERVERAMEFVPKERIVLNPDCGFAPSAINPMDFDEAYMKLSTMCLGAQQLRIKYA